MRSKLPITLFLGLAIITGSCGGQRQQNGGSRREVVNETYVHKYGLSIPQKEWSNRGETGQVVSMLKSGVVVVKNYVNGVLEGEATYSFPHSRAVQRVDIYANGELIKTRDNHLSGAPKMEIEYLSPEERTVVVWYDDGTPHYRETYALDKLIAAEYYTTTHQVESRIAQGEGNKVERDDFGRLLFIDRYADGEKVLRTTYYPNEAPKEIIPYVEGKVCGVKKTFLPAGEPATVEEWSDNCQDGVTVAFQNGEKVSQTPYVKGVKHGIEERYRDGQFVAEEIPWKQGRKHGPCYCYIGEASHVSWFYEGTEVTRAQYDRMTRPGIR